MAQKDPRGVAQDEHQSFIEWCIRTAVFVVFYAGQSVMINLSQFLGLLLYPFSKALYHDYIEQTQKCFGVLLVAITQFFAPSVFVVTTDESAKDFVKKDWKNNGRLFLNVPERIILIANHQIYADWIYIWCFAYFANAHDAIKIILKQSLKWLPIFGWGMQFFQFIFLKRSWAADKDHLKKTMRDLTKSMEPLWLLIFPEGTLISDCTRKTSQKFAEKAGLVDHKHLLLPRSTGLLFCMKELQESVDYIYDMTIGFDGVQSGEYPEDRYTLRRIFFEGRYPPTIHVHVRRYAIADIPKDENKFTEWLRQRWTEKDDLMTEFYSKGRFTSIYDSPKIMKIQMRNIIELAQIWYFMVPCVIVWYLINTYSFGWAIPSI